MRLPLPQDTTGYIRVEGLSPRMSDHCFMCQRHRYGSPTSHKRPTGCCRKIKWPVIEMELLASARNLPRAQHGCSANRLSFCGGREGSARSLQAHYPTNDWLRKKKKRCAGQQLLPRSEKARASQALRIVTCCPLRGTSKRGRWRGRAVAGWPRRHPLSRHKQRSPPPAHRRRPPQPGRRYRN
jgi:hypothetical protein